MAISRGQAIELIRSYEFSVSSRKISKLLSLSAAIVISQKMTGPLSPTGSYFGGQPHLMSGEGWPTWNRTEAVRGVLPGYRSQVADSGLVRQEYIDELEAMLEQPVTALPFIGQINLDRVQRVCDLPNLPRSGVMQFFYDRDTHYHGFDPRHADGFRVLYYPSATELVLAQPPASMPSERQFSAHAIEFQPMWTVPHWQSDDSPINEKDEEEHDMYIDLVDELEQTCLDGRRASARLGGWAPFIQGDLRMDCQLQSHGINPMRQFDEKPDKRIKALARGKRDWKLLMQIDSASELDWCWGDAGYVYFYALEKESRAGDLSGVCAKLQC